MVKNFSGRRIRCRSVTGEKRGVSKMKRFISMLFVAMLGLFSGSVFAVPVDLTSLTASVDFSTTITAILLVAAALAGVYIAWKAAKMVLGALKGG